MTQYNDPRQAQGGDRFVDGHINFRLDTATGRVRIMGEGPASAFGSFMLKNLHEHPGFAAPSEFEIPSVPRQFTPAPPPDDRLDRIEAAIVALAKQQNPIRQVDSDWPGPRRVAATETDIVTYEPPAGPERFGPPPPPPPPPQHPDDIGNMGIPLYDLTFTFFVRDILRIRHEVGTFAVSFTLFLLAVVLGYKVGLPMALNLISASPEGQELLATNKAPPSP